MVEIRPNRDGFWATFRNGWGISVQWQEIINYADKDGTTAEVAVLVPNPSVDGTLYGWPATILNCRRAGVENGISPSGDDVIGWLRDFDVLKAMTIVANFSPDAEEGAVITVFRDLFYDKAGAWQ